MNLPLPGASSLPVPVGTGEPAAAIDARSEIDKRIATAPVTDLPAIIRARGAIIEQDEYRLEGTHLRRGQMGVFYSKVGFSIVAVAGGAGLIAAGFGLPGFFLLGGAAAVYVPEYVKNWSTSSAKAAAMQNNRNLPYYFAALLVTVAAGLLGLLTLEQIAREMMQILAIIAGASFFSGLFLLLGQTRQPRSAPLIQINFNGRKLQKELGDIVDAEYTEVLDTIHPVEREAYADDDLVMALAKVRIDLERQVRRLAHSMGTLREDQRFELRRALEALERSGKVPNVVIIAIRDILPICNRAIHGEVIDVGDARNVINIAREVMVILEGEFMKETTSR